MKYSYPYYRLTTSFSLEGPQSAFPIGFQDTVKVYIRNSAPPYNVVDSSKGVNEYSTFLEFMYVYSFFNNVTASGSYYVVLKHRNSVETWSRQPKQLFNDVIPYYFFPDSASKAYGNNQKLLTTDPFPLYGLYSGDVNQDGGIDLTDVTLIYNAASNFITGYVAADVTCNNSVDLTDITIAYNNSAGFVSIKRP